MNWVWIIDNWLFGDCFDKDFNRVWQWKGEFDILIMFFVMFMYV